MIPCNLFVFFLAQHGLQVCSNLGSVKWRDAASQLWQQVCEKSTVWRTPFFATFEDVGGTVPPMGLVGLSPIIMGKGGKRGPQMKGNDPIGDTPMDSTFSHEIMGGFGGLQPEEVHLTDEGYSMPVADALSLNRLFLGSASLDFLKRVNRSTQDGEKRFPKRKKNTAWKSNIDNQKMMVWKIVISGFPKWQFLVGYVKFRGV